MRTRMQSWSLVVAASVFALPMLSWGQLTQYDLETRMGTESHVGNVTGHAKDAKTAYRRYCVGCHGPLGDGNGENFPWVDPKPRDFQLGIFKCRSTPTPLEHAAMECAFGARARRPGSLGQAFLAALCQRQAGNSHSDSSRTGSHGGSHQGRTGRFCSSAVLEVSRRSRPSKRSVGFNPSG